MSRSQPPEITADDVHEAGNVLEQLLQRTAANAVDSPALDQLAAAKREPDRVKRLTKMSQALKQGAKDALAAQQRLQQSQRDVDSGGRNFTPEALEELEALKTKLKKKIRQRAEEELARAYPENPNAKKTRPPRRNRINI